ncbi:hypothetical protein QKA_2149 [Clostridioides difficile DA00165]|nr:hypothetical protein QKA_2149 [Clostridioides difficile DA00165]
MVYFGNLKHPSKAIIHTGDNLTGKGEGDDEQIIVNLEDIPEYVHKIVFGVSIYSYQDLANEQLFYKIN